MKKIFGVFVLLVAMRVIPASAESSSRGAHQAPVETNVANCASTLNHVQTLKKICTSPGKADFFGQGAWGNGRDQFFCFNRGLEAALAGRGAEDITAMACRWSAHGDGMTTPGESLLCFQNAVKFYPDSKKLQAADAACRGSSRTISVVNRCYASKLDEKTP